MGFAGLSSVLLIISILYSVQSLSEPDEENCETLPSEINIIKGI